MNKTDRTRLRELAERWKKEVSDFFKMDALDLADSVLPLLTRVEELEKALSHLLSHVERKGNACKFLAVAKAESALRGKGETSGR